MKYLAIITITPALLFLLIVGSGCYFLYLILNKIYVFLKKRVRKNKKVNDKIKFTSYGK